jgi:hypothetical protein
MNRDAVAVSGRSRLFFPLLILVALTALSVRIEDLSFLSEGLFAEDGCCSYLSRMSPA